MVHQCQFFFCRVLINFIYMDLRPKIFVRGKGDRGRESWGGKLIPTSWMKVTPLNTAAAQKAFGGVVILHFLQIYCMNVYAKNCENRLTYVKVMSDDRVGSFEIKLTFLIPNIVAKFQRTLSVK